MRQKKGNPILLPSLKSMLAEASSFNHTSLFYNGFSSFVVPPRHRHAVAFPFT
jgi:hypothetical protein